MTIDEARRSIKNVMEVLYTHGIAINDIKTMGQILAHQVPSSEWDENITATQALLWSVIYFQIVDKNEIAKPSVTFRSLLDAAQSPQGLPAMFAILQSTIELAIVPYPFF